MKQCVLLLLALACAHGAPAERKDSQPPASCKDPLANGAAAQAMDKINLELSEGYILSLERLSNVQHTRHGETGVVYYLTIDVLETKCHVLSKKNWRNCAVRDIGEHPVYGQCRAVIYINRVHRVSRLYKYSCAVRPVPVSKIVLTCPDCPVLFPVDNEEVQKTMRLGMEKFNKEKSLANYFSPLNVTRATSQGGIMTFYSVEFTIQETVCSSNKTDIADVSKCDLMSCEFAHKGLCKASLSRSQGIENLRVECEVFEPEAAEEEKKRHLLGGELDHSHSKTADLSSGHDHTHDHTHSHSHSHSHPHTHEHEHKPEAKPSQQGKASSHHHTHDHSEGHGHDHSHSHSHAHSHSHGHDHSHDHAHDHDHAHSHHAKAHNHTHDHGVHHHHIYNHTNAETHEHDHELALDHEHKHAHLHEHEHHHHHHDHKHEEDKKRKPEGVVYVLASMDKPVTLPSFPDKPVADSALATTLALRLDPDIPGQQEPTIRPFPTTQAKECPAAFKTENKLIKEVFAQDPLFKSVTCEKPVTKLAMFAQCS